MARVATALLLVTLTAASGCGGGDDEGRQVLRDYNMGSRPRWRSAAAPNRWAGAAHRRGRDRPQSGAAESAAGAMSDPRDRPATRASPPAARQRVTQQWTVDFAPFEAAARPRT